MKLVKVKINYIALKDMKIKLLEIISFMNQQIYDFQIFKIIKSFNDSIYNHKIEIHKASQEQAELLEYISNFNKKIKQRSDEDKKIYLSDSAKNLYEGRELVPDAFKSGLFPLKSTKGTKYYLKYYFLKKCFKGN